MMLLRLLLLLALLGPPVLRGQVTEFPQAPSGQVLDSGESLGAARRNHLENELGRLRKDYHLDVMVVLWDRTLPPDTALEELATRIGETWGREELWAVVLHIPDSVQRPALAVGGSFLDTVTEDALIDAQEAALLRALKERTTNAQVGMLGLEIGEELIYLRHRRDFERKSYVAARDQQLRDREQRHQRMIFRAVIVTLLSLVAVGTVAILYVVKRRPTNLSFPETRWRRRLGAPWSGGGHIVASLPSRIP